jgi:hypothetical protein
MPKVTRDGRAGKRAAHRVAVSADTSFEGSEEWKLNGKAPAAISRILQCLAEEAVGQAQTIHDCIALAVRFSHGCMSPDYYRAIALGPYAEEFLAEAERVYLAGDQFDGGWLRNSYASMLWFRAEADAFGRNLYALVGSWLDSADPRDNVRASLLVAGGCWRDSKSVQPNVFDWRGVDKAKLERLIFSENSFVRTSAAWAWALAHYHSKFGIRSIAHLDRMVELWLANAAEEDEIFAFGISQAAGISRGLWKPVIPDDKRELLRSLAEGETTLRKVPSGVSDERAAIVICYYAGDIFAPEKMASLVAGQLIQPTQEGGWEAMLANFGDAGQAALKTARERLRNKRGKLRKAR